jgi:hypothetical protein
MIRRTVSLLVISCLLAGCYSYAPLAGPAPPRATRVHVALDAPTDVQAGRAVLPDVTRVDGELVRLSRDSLVLSAKQAMSETGTSDLPGWPTVSLPRAGIASIYARKFSIARTLALVAGIAAFVALSPQAFSQSGAAGSGGGGGGAAR